MFMCNDVSTLYEERHGVARHLGVPVTDLDIVWNIPSVREELGMCHEEESTEPEPSMEPEESMEPGQEDSAEILSRCAAMIQDTSVQIIGLRHQIMMIGAIGLALHSAIALASLSASGVPVLDTATVLLQVSRGVLQRLASRLCGALVA